MGQVQKVTTGTTFINGVLVPPNTPVFVDTDQVDLDDTLEDENGKKLKGKKDVGLVDYSKRDAPITVVMGAIAPTGPNPTAPQQLAPGMLQTIDGYATAEGAPVVGEGSEAAAEVEEGGTPAVSRSRKSKTEEALS